MYLYRKINVMAKKFKIVQSANPVEVETQLEEAAKELKNFKVEGFNSKVIVEVGETKAKIAYAALFSYDEN